MPLLFCLLLLVVGPLYGHHNPLVPRPQQIRYGAGRLRLKGLTISFGSSPVPEDRFAADELASALTNAVGSATPVMSGKVAAGSIVLYRADAVDALPGA